MTKICESCVLRDKGVCAVLIGTPPDEEVCRNRKQGVIKARSFLQKGGDKKGIVKMIRKGWAVSVEVTPDGNYMTSEILVSGDLVGAALMTERGIRRTIRAMTDVEYCGFEVDFLKPLVLSRQDLLEAVIQVSTDMVLALRERVVDLGTRSAEARVASLVVGIHDKLEERGLLSGPRMPFPLRQQDIADALGLTQVHTNRVLKNLRETGVLTIDRKEVYVSDVEKIRVMIR